MTSGKDIRDEQADYRQSVEDRFLASAEKHPDVTAAAREAAETEVRRQNQADFDAAVAAIQETADKANDN